MISQPEAQGQSKHLICVVCGQGFNAYYSGDIRAFPVYHYEDIGKKRFNCEFLFYQALLRTYSYLHRVQISLPMNDLIRSSAIKENIVMRKEMLLWCLARGYLSVDRLKRIMIPPPVEDVCKEIFANYNLDDNASAEEAIEYLKAALRCLNDELERVEAADLEENPPTPKSVKDPLDDEIPPLLKEEEKGSRMATMSFRGLDHRSRRG